MPYILDDQTFPTKSSVTQRCSAILRRTPLGAQVSPLEAPFLFALFRYHTEWDQKRGPGVAAITVGDTGYGTLGFWLRRVDGTTIDISFTHAVKHLPTGRERELLPQLLIDFKNGARVAVKDQITAFRVNNTFVDCGIAMEVDHLYPNTFDALLHRFCVEYHINPLQVKVLELATCSHYIQDDALRMAWEAYHKQHAQLRLVPKTVNATAPKAKVDWSVTWGAVAAATEESHQ
jgi:hypothetical protein